MGDFKVAYRETPSGLQLICIRCGIGAERAENAARWLVDRRASALAVMGVSGGLNPELEPGGIVVAGTILNPEESQKPKAWAADPEFAGSFFSAAASERLPVFQGSIATASHPVFSRTEKELLFRKTGAFAVDLESAGVAAVAAGAGLPLFAVRTICDCAADDVPSEFCDLLDARGVLRSRILAALLFRRPRLAAEMILYGRRFSAALKSLRAAFHILERILS